MKTAFSPDGPVTSSDEEVERLVTSALRVILEKGYGGATVAAILSEAGLATRAFYRHFASKDELLVAIFDRQQELSARRIYEAMEEVGSTRERFEVWVDRLLDLVYDPRARRATAVLQAEAARLRQEHPDVVLSAAARLMEPLQEVLEQGKADGTFPLADPELDTRSIHAVVWSLLEPRLTTPRKGPTRAQARAHFLRFCLPALGAAVEE